MHRSQSAPRLRQLPSAAERRLLVRKLRRPKSPSSSSSPLPGIRFATQSGPMLVIDGKHPPASSIPMGNRGIRNGVGIAPMARRLRDQRKVGFIRQIRRFFRDCTGVRNALYLDGNVSSLWDPVNGAATRMTSSAPWSSFSKTRRQRLVAHPAPNPKRLHGLEHVVDANDLRALLRGLEREGDASAEPLVGRRFARQARRSCACGWLRSRAGSRANGTARARSSARDCARASCRSRSRDRRGCLSRWMPAASAAAIRSSSHR